MITIIREELKKKLDDGEDFKLINCLDDWMFRAKRIPGSIHFESLKHALDTLDPKEEVIVYCSNFGCTASVLVYQQLVDHGFQNESYGARNPDGRAVSRRMRIDGDVISSLH